MPTKTRINLALRVCDGMTDQELEEALDEGATFALALDACEQLGEILEAAPCLVTGSGEPVRMH